MIDSKLATTTLRAASAAALIATAAFTTALAPGALRAQQAESATFDVYLRGIRAGVLAFSGTDNGREYAASGRLESSGIVGALVKVRYDAQARGRVTSKGFVPSSYREKTSGIRENEAVMTYKGGVPQVKKYTPPKPRDENAVAPATMGGTVDPMTAIYGTLRDVSREEVCNFSTRMYDGKRASRIQISNPQPIEGGFRCSGEYRRVKGYSAEEMAEKQRFPFTLTYQKTGKDRFRVTEMALDTTFGGARLVRR